MPSQLVRLGDERLCATCKHQFLTRHFAVQRCAALDDPGVVAPLGSDCSTHGGEPAYAICERCGDFMCPLCTTPYEGRFYCVPCFELQWSRGSLRAARRPEPAAWPAFLLATLAVVGSPVPVLNLLLVGAAAFACGRVLVDRQHTERLFAVCSLVLTVIALVLALLSLAPRF